MKLMLAIAFCLLTFLGTLGQTPASSSSQVRAINVYAKQIDLLIKRRPEAHRLFGDVASGYKDEPSRWESFTTVAAKEKADTGENLNQVAEVWLKNGKVVGMDLTLQSPSRDWVHGIRYYFRNEGTLAKIRAEVSSFYGDFTLRREHFYDSSGKLLHTSSRYFNLFTKKPIKPNPKNLPDFPVPVYLKLEDLPFYKLL